MLKNAKINYYNKKVFNATSQTQFTDYNSLNIYKLSSKMGFELRIKNQKKGMIPYRYKQTFFNFIIYPCMSLILFYENVKVPIGSSMLQFLSLIRFLTSSFASL